MRKSRLRRFAGFTLVELLAVMVIIALLGSLIIPVITKAYQKACVRRARADISSLCQAIEAYKLDWKEYPPMDENRTWEPTSYPCLPIVGNRALFQALTDTGRGGPYMVFKDREIVTDIHFTDSAGEGEEFIDPFGNPYIYKRLSGVTRDYIIYSLGPDGSFRHDEHYYRGGSPISHGEKEDDIGNW